MSDFNWAAPKNSMSDALQAARDLVQERLPPELADALCEHLNELIDSRMAIDPASMFRHGYQASLGQDLHWFVKNNEIDVIAGLSTVAAAIIGFSTPIGLAAPLLLGVAGLVVRLAQKNIQLSDRDAAVLMYLKHQDVGQTTEEMARGLNAIRAKTGFTFAALDLETQLTRLKNVQQADGEAVPVVSESGGRWRSSAI
jgi:hypothetical protein